MTKYAILGTGALGGLYGGKLALAGHDVHFLIRSDFDHVQAHGLKVESHWGNFEILQPQVYSTASEMPKVDVVIVAWKATANDALAGALEHVCDTNTRVLVLQNGYDVERAAAAIVGEDRVLGGCCFLCCNKIGPGHIHHLDYGRIEFGEFGRTQVGKSTAWMQRIESEFESAGIPTQARESLQDVRWKKLMWNVPYNGLSVVFDANTQEIMQDPASSQLARDLMLDVREAAAACGTRIESDFADKMLRDTQKMVPYDSSMLLDYRARRPIEVEAIFGNLIRAAQRQGYHPQKVEMLYRQLQFLDRRNRSDQ